jgi:NADH-quinone oxidoreductase subunit N
VNLDALVRNVVEDTIGKGGSLWAFRPELTICATIIAVLLVRAFAPRWKQSAFYLTFFGLFIAFAMCSVARGHWFVFFDSVPTASTIFTGTLVSDSFSVVMRAILLFFALMYVCFVQTAAVDQQENLTEFVVLMLGALLGMCLMVSANHILIVMLGVEMASVPCYVLAGAQRSRPKGSEASLKYAVFGAGAAGVMLYGLSLLAGVLGSAHLPTMATRLAMMIQHGIDPNHTMVLVLGGLMLMVGVAFKLSAFPFHFWAPDVFEGTSAEVAAFLSIASKAAALGLLVRLATGFGFVSGPTLLESLAPVRSYIVALLAIMAAVTCTFGNLAAYGQTNMKRLLAYSTIAHAGYMMMPIAAAVALIGPNPENQEAARSAIASLVVYIGIYLFMNLAAFAIVAFLRNALGSEEIADYAGLVRTSPGLTVCMAIVMFSLVGLPPFAGVWAKVTIIISMINAAETSPGFWALVLVAVLNTVLSLFYYLRVVRVMVLSPAPLHQEPPTIPFRSMVGVYCALLTTPVIVLFFWLGGLMNWAHAAASALFF